MASWRKNPVVGIVAGVIFVISLIIVINGIVQRMTRKAPVLSEEEKQKQIQGVRKFTPPPPPR